jgi:hypothetical protein
MLCAVKDGSALLTDLFVFSEPVPAVVSLIERAVMTVCEDRSNLYNIMFWGRVAGRVVVVVQRAYVKRGA